MPKNWEFMLQSKHGKSTRDTLMSWAGPWKTGCLRQSPGSQGLAWAASLRDTSRPPPRDLQPQCLPAGLGCHGLKNPREPAWPEQGGEGRLGRERKCPVSTVFPSLVDTDAIKNLVYRDFPGGAVVENLPANAGDTGSSPGLGGSHMPRSN